MINYISNGKVTTIHLIVWLIKKTLLYKMSYFPEPHSDNKNKIKVELNFSNYVTKSDSNNAAGVDTTYFAKKADWANLKLDVEKLDKDKLVKISSGLNSLNRNIGNLDVDKLKIVSIDLKKLRDVVDKNVFKSCFNKK